MPHHRPVWIKNTPGLNWIFRKEKDAETSRLEASSAPIRPAEEPPLIYRRRHRPAFIKNTPVFGRIFRKPKDRAEPLAETSAPAVGRPASPAREGPALTGARPLEEPRPVTAPVKTLPIEETPADPGSTRRRGSTNTERVAFFLSAEGIDAAKEQLSNDPKSFFNNFNRYQLYDFFDNIEKYDLDDRAKIELARRAVHIVPNLLARNIADLGIEAENVRIELARTLSRTDIFTLTNYIQDFDIQDHQVQIELAREVLAKSFRSFPNFIENARIQNAGVQDKEDLKELYLAYCDLHLSDIAAAGVITQLAMEYLWRTAAAMFPDDPALQVSMYCDGIKRIEGVPRVVFDLLDDAQRGRDPHARKSLLIWVAHTCMESRRYSFSDEEWLNMKPLLDVIFRWHTPQARYALTQILLWQSMPQNSGGAISFKDFSNTFSTTRTPLFPLLLFSFYQDRSLEENANDESLKRIKSLLNQKEYKNVKLQTPVVNGLLSLSLERSLSFPLQRKLLSIVASSATDMPVLEKAKGWRDLLMKQRGTDAEKVDRITLMDSLSDFINKDRTLSEILDESPTPQLLNMERKLHEWYKSTRFKEQRKILESISKMMKRDAAHIFAKGARCVTFLSIVAAEQSALGAEIRQRLEGVQTMAEIDQILPTLFIQLLDMEDMADQDRQLVVEYTQGSRSAIEMILFTAKMRDALNDEEKSAMLAALRAYFTSTILSPDEPEAFSRLRYDSTPEEAIHMRTIKEMAPQVYDQWPLDSVFIPAALEGEDSSAASGKEQEIFRYLREHIVTEGHVSEDTYPALLQVLNNESTAAEILETTTVFADGEKELLLLCAPSSLREKTLLLNNIVSGMPQSQLRRDLVKLGGMMTGFYDTDDAEDLFHSGEVAGSCMPTDADAFHGKPLMAFVLDGKYRMIVKKSVDGRGTARAMLRLLVDETLQKPVLQLERIYSNPGASLKVKETKEAIVNFARQKARELDVTLVTSEKDIPAAEVYPNSLKFLGSPWPFEYIDAQDVGLRRGNEPYTFLGMHTVA